MPNFSASEAIVIGGVTYVITDEAKAAEIKMQGEILKALRRINTK